MVISSDRALALPISRRLLTAGRDVPCAMDTNLLRAVFATGAACSHGTCRRRYIGFMKLMFDVISNSCRTSQPISITKSMTKFYILLTIVVI